MPTESGERRQDLSYTNKEKSEDWAPKLAGRSTKIRGLEIGFYSETLLQALVGSRRM